MRAYNCRKTPKEHYLFKKKNRKISLTILFSYIDIDGTEQKEKNFYHGIFRMKREKEKLFIQGDTFKIREFFKTLAMIVEKSNGTSITRTMKFYEKNNSNDIKVDLSKAERKDFVSRNIIQINEILRRKGAIEYRQQEEING